MHLRVTMKGLKYYQLIFSTPTGWTAVAPTELIISDFKVPMYRIQFLFRFKNKIKENAIQKYYISFKI